MKNFSVRKADGAVLARKVLKAEGFFDRLRGLLGRSGLAEGEALWIDPCHQIHTFFMAFPIDVVFLDPDGKVLRVDERLGPWRVAPAWTWPWSEKSRSVLELGAGVLGGSLKRGDRLVFEASSHG